jgi:hypothetical protein
MRSAVVLAACLLLGAAAAPSSDPTPVACPYQAQIFVYGQNGWDTLTSALAANQTPCANYYVVLTATGDKTKPRGSAPLAAIHAKGPNFHALAEFNMGAWAKVKPADWSAKGRLFRQRMAAAGYVPGRDTWAINELSSGVRTKPVAQARARDAMRGLYTGPRGAGPQQGAVFVVGIGQQLVNFGPYKGQLEGWLGNAAWWTAVSPYVAWWAQEAYPSCSKVCVAGAKVGTRSTRLNEFVEHPARRPAADRTGARPLRPRVPPAHDRLLARREGLREQPHLTAADGDAREPRGLRGPRVGDPQPVSGRADRICLERAPAGRHACPGAGARDPRRTVGPGRLRRRRDGDESLQPDRLLRVVQGSARRRQVQSGLGDVR